MKLKKKSYGWGLKTEHGRYRAIGNINTNEIEVYFYKQTNEGTTCRRIGSCKTKKLCNKLIQLHHDEWEKDPSFSRVPPLYEFYSVGD